jgi:hypothetical protein
VGAGLVERHAHDTRKRRDRHRDVPSHARVRAVREVPDGQVRLRELGFREQAAPRADRRPAEGGRRLDVQDLDRQHVAAPRASDGDRPGQRMAAERTTPEHVVVCRGRGIVAVGGIARVEDHGIARIDLEPRRQRVVPGPVNDGPVEVMRRHSDLHGQAISFHTTMPVPDRHATAGM